jgi:hypothetical protein
MLVDGLLDGCVLAVHAGHSLYMYGLLIMWTVESFTSLFYTDHSMYMYGLLIIYDQKSERNIIMKYFIHYYRTNHSMSVKIPFK